MERRWKKYQLFFNRFNRCKWTILNQHNESDTKFEITCEYGFPSTIIQNELNVLFEWRYCPFCGCRIEIESKK